MFKNAVRMIPALNARFASSLVARPSVAAPMVPSMKQSVQWMRPTNTTFQSVGVLQQVVEKIEPVSEAAPSEMVMTSVLRKRRLKMKKHKLRKRRKAQRALRIKIGK